MTPSPFACGLPLPAQFGRYRLDSLHSQSEQVQVYAGHDPQLGRPVIVKVFPFRPEESPQLRDRFGRDACAASTLAHPNLCPIYEVGQVAGGWYVVTPPVGGARLADLLAGGNNLPARPAAALTGRVAAALQAGHGRGLIHRRLTPASILIVGKEPLVMDLAQVRPPLPSGGPQRWGGAVADLAYLPPEQLATEATHPASNVYSLGAILYHALTGRPPFQGSGQTVLRHIETQEPVRPRALRPDLDPALEAICLQALAKKIEDRFPHAGALADALNKTRGPGQAAAAGRPVPVGRPVAPPPVELPPQTPLPVPAEGTGRGEGVTGRRSGQSLHPVTPSPGHPVRVWPWVAGVSAVLALVAATVWWVGWGEAEEQQESSSPPGAQQAQKEEPKKGNGQKSKGKPAPRRGGPRGAAVAGGGRKSSRTDPVDPDFDAGAEDPVIMEKGLPLVKVKWQFTIDARGDARFNARVKFPDGFLDRLKKMLSHRGSKPKPATVLHYLGLAKVGSLLTVKPRYGEDSLDLEGKERGWAKRQEGCWVSDLSSDPRLEYRLLVKKGKARTVLLRAQGQKEGFNFWFTAKIQLPPGAHKIRVKSKPNRLLYQARPPVVGPGLAAKKPAARLEVKPKIMSALHKVYANRKWPTLWVARCIFTNHGKETLTDYRVRFKIKDYAGWSDWEKCEEVYPGQTVVDTYFPIRDAKVRLAATDTTAELKMEYRYVRPNGQRVQDTAADNILILGMNQVMFTDLPVDAHSSWYEKFKDAPLVIASFVTAEDPVIKDVLGLISKEIGGAWPSQNDANAQRFMNALYDLFRANIAYEGAKADAIDGVLHQDLKYGREVLRTKSGTCINLAILYASVAEAAGLEAYIMVVPGHAFPAVRLPGSRKYMCVETTLCKGGTFANSSPFAQAVDSARSTYIKESSRGLLMAIDLKLMHRLGATPPELPDLGRNPLAAWKIVLPSNFGLAQEPSPLVGYWKVGSALYDSGYFHGDGTFALWHTRRKKKPFQGEYKYFNDKGRNFLVIKSLGQKKPMLVEWAGDIQSFRLRWLEAGRLVWAPFKRLPLGAKAQVLKKFPRQVAAPGRKGLEFRCLTEIKHAPGLPCVLEITFTKDGQVLKGTKKPYESRDGSAGLWETITPDARRIFRSNATYFIPYEALGLKPGTHALKYRVRVWCVRDKRYLYASKKLQAVNVTVPK
jgi:hypothetical protein